MLLPAMLAGSPHQNAYTGLKEKSMKNATILLSALLALTASFAFAGQLHPRLEAKVEA